AVRAGPGARPALRGPRALAGPREPAPGGPAAPARVPPPADERGAERPRDRGPEPVGLPRRRLGAAPGDRAPMLGRGPPRRAVQAQLRAARRPRGAVSGDELPVPHHDA